MCYGPLGCRRPRSIGGCGNTVLTGKRCLQSNERRIALANIEESRQPYYDVLQTYDEQEDSIPLVQFLEAQTVKTWSRSTDGKNPAPQKN